MSELSLAGVQTQSSVTDVEYPLALISESLLASAEVALLLVGADLRMHYISPAAMSLLSIGKTDLGERLDCIQAVANDVSLDSDFHEVLRSQKTAERDIRTPQGRWLLRRILPYRHTERTLDGVIVTFLDITQREAAARDMRIAKQRAEQASLASVRRLSGACHDLRQPMHTLGLIGGLLACSSSDATVQRLVNDLDRTLRAMSGMLSSLHYGCKLTSGTINPDQEVVSIEAVFNRLQHEFSYHAEASGLKLRIVPSSLAIKSDADLFEQLVRSLLEHITKNSRRSRILVGCRRKRDVVRVELWHSDALPPEANETSEARLLVPSFGPHIAKRLADLMGFRLRGSSHPGRGPAYTIEIPILPAGTEPEMVDVRSPPRDRPNGSALRVSGGDAGPPVEAASKAVIYIVDDDEDVCERLKRLLESADRTVETFATAEAFLSNYRPQSRTCLIVDAYLTGIHGIDLVRRLNDAGCRPPTIMISGRGDVDVVVQAMKAGALDFIEKPINSRDLLERVEQLISHSEGSHRAQVERLEISMRISRLTPRQKQVLQLMLDGRSSKRMAAELFMSQRTVESHRATIMKKMAVKSLPELARMVSIVGGSQLAGGGDSSPGAQPQ